MASIYLRGNVWWLKGTMLGKPVRKPLSPNKKIANEMRAEFEVAAAAAKYGHKGGTSKPWRYCVDKYMAWSEREMTGVTHAHNRRAFQLFEEAFAPRTMADITPARLDELKHYMEDHGIGLYARERAIRALKAGMRRMEIEHELPIQRWDIVRNVKLPQGRVDYFKHEEVVKMLKACRKPHWRSIILLGARCGLRAGEIYNLQWQNVLWDKGTHGSLDICPKEDWTPKAGKSRIVPMTAEVAEHLRLEQKRARSEYVIAEGEWRPSGIDSVGHVFNKILKSVKLEGFIHKLRHTYGTDLARLGYSAEQIAVVMGHSTSKMTQRYIHLSADDVSDIAKRLKSYGA